MDFSTSFGSCMPLVYVLLLQVDVDARVKIGGRDTTNFNLGVFNPIWRSRGDRLSKEEAVLLNKSSSKL